MRVKVFVDTAPVMEKPLAAASGLGWQGKHTVLISREHGNWLLLGAIYTSADLVPDSAESDHCGSCRRCLDICPTGAFPRARTSSMRAAASAYLSIEHKGHIPREFRAAMGNRVFGCDDCLAVCPWNKFAASRARKQSLRQRRPNSTILHWRTFWHVWTTPRFARALRVRRSSARGATESCAMSLIAASATPATMPTLDAVKPNAVWTIPSPIGARHGGLGARAGSYRHGGDARPNQQTRKNRQRSGRCRGPCAEWNCEGLDHARNTTS